MAGTKRTILVVLGTRPEAVKLAPVILYMKGMPELRVRVVFTSQHRQIAPDILRTFRVRPDYDLNIMRPGQTPSNVLRQVMRLAGEVYLKEKPDMVMVQGDTTTAMAAALQAFHQHIPVAHVEAGLRTDDRYNPFPEEINRRIITQLASLHLAATPGNRDRLLHEGVRPADVALTGNPVIDALRFILRTKAPERSLPAVLSSSRPRGIRTILLTTHRRENLGQPQHRIFQAVGRIVETHPDVHVVFPVHPNPAVLQAVRQHLAPHPRVHCVESMDYPSFVWAMKRSYVVMSDSGGVQEEAPALGVPVVVLRGQTERPEIIATGNGVLAGTQTGGIVKVVNGLLDDAELYRRMCTRAYPYGRGQASAKITRAVLAWLRRWG